MILHDLAPATRRAGRLATAALAFLPAFASGCSLHDALVRDRRDQPGPTTLSGTDRPLNSTIGTNPADFKPGRMDGPSAPGVDLP